MNILVINLKGGVAKTTNSSIIASYFPNSTLIEIDKINRSDSKIISKDYESIQMDFKSEEDDQFLDFENLLLEYDTTKIIDVGAVKLEIFHRSMKAANLYNLIDLLIIPAMDGSDDFTVAMSYLNTIKDDIHPNKIMFSFNRFNEHEYSSYLEQFNSFFTRAEEIKKTFSIDLTNHEDNYYVLKDSRAVKIARQKQITLKSLIDLDIDEITKKQRATKDKTKRMELTKQRSLILSAQNFYNEYVINMIQKITQKLEKNNEVNK